MKNAVNFIGAFEEALSQEAIRHSADGVVCGHIHHATIRTLNGITYVNTGDFVESCSVVAEHHDGRLEILHWLTFGPGVQTDETTAEMEAETKVAA